MAVGTGLEPRRHGRRLAGALWRESEARVLVTWKERGARAGPLHPRPLQSPRRRAGTGRGPACPPLLPDGCPQGNCPSQGVGRKLCPTPQPASTHLVQQRGPQGGCPALPHWCAASSRGPRACEQTRKSWGPSPLSSHDTRRKKRRRRRKGSGSHPHKTVTCRMCGITKPGKENTE